jgi:hypothetical protein
MAKKNTSKPIKPKGYIGESKKDIDSLRKAMEIPPKTTTGSNKKK